MGEGGWNGLEWEASPFHAVLVVCCASESEKRVIWWLHSTQWLKK